MSSRSATTAIPASQTSLQLDENLKRFYESLPVNLSTLLENESLAFPYRFVRLNPRYSRDETLDLLTQELKDSSPTPVPWLNSSLGFYALPSTFSLANSTSFRTGRVYGMDVSSGAAAAVLLSSEYDKQPPISTSDIPRKLKNNRIRVLDLCSSPGLKLCALTDCLGNNSEATVIGVDVSENRMALTKKIVWKYQIDQAARGNSPAEQPLVQLYCEDGTTFGTYASQRNVVFDSRLALEESRSRGNRKRMNKSAKARERKRLKQLAAHRDTDCITPKVEVNISGSHINVEQFDFVLVDAECSTDGSMKHMLERMKEGVDGVKTNLMLSDAKQLSDLVKLQQRLLESGFRLLKPGGKLVYSTCSLAQEQNEGVVEWLLNRREDAELVPVHFPRAKSQLVVEGFLKGTIRFYPNISGTPKDFFGDGFFLSKLTKKG